MIVGEQHPRTLQRRSRRRGRHGVTDAVVGRGAARPGAQATILVPRRAWVDEEVRQRTQTLQHADNPRPLAAESGTSKRDHSPRP